jgi:hypothetical protein
MQNEVLDLVNVTINQNYFKINHTYWKQEDGTPMGSPISSILGEIFLQKLERKFYTNIKENRHIRFFARYIDDVLIIYDSATTTAESFLEDHNAMHSKMKHNMETKNNQQINYLDLNIHRKTNEIVLGIYTNLHTQMW